jgi:hypothetical protein
MTKNFFLVVAGVVAVLGRGQLLAAAEQAGDFTLLEAVKDPLLQKTIYRMEVESLRRTPHFAADGAMGQNDKWERGAAPEWFIEGQRWGAESVQAGMVMNNDALVRQGWLVLDWGFSKQSKDSGFAGTGDPFHSVSLFVEGAARALLLMRESGDPKQARTVKKHAPALHAAALWLLRPEVVRKYDAPYTHRRYILAAALGQTAAVVGDAALAQAAAAYARDGLQLQRTDGVNPEKGGYDVNYQMVGVLMAGRYYAVCDDAELRARIRTMIQRAGEFEMTKMDGKGVLSTEGSTRMGHEPGRGGKIKTVGYKEMLQAFLLASQITGDKRFRACAERIAVGQKWLMP